MSICVGETSSWTLAPRLLDPLSPAEIELAIQAVRTQIKGGRALQLPVCELQEHRDVRQQWWDNDGATPAGAKRRRMPVAFDSTRLLPSSPRLTARWPPLRRPAAGTGTTRRAGRGLRGGQQPHSRGQGAAACRRWAWPARRNELARRAPPTPIPIPMRGQSTGILG